MSTHRFYSALTLVLSIAMGGCAVIPNEDTDPTGEIRLMQMHAINAQMQQILVQRQSAHRAPASSSLSVYTPTPARGVAPATRPRCRSSELVCGGNDYRCQAQWAGVPLC